MAKLAAFPKAWLNDLGSGGSMTVESWIDLSLDFDVDGLEFYADFAGLDDPGKTADYRRRVEDQGRAIPMLCCSPDFTHPDTDFRAAQIDQEKRWIDLAAQLGAGFCRILSGQARPEVSRADGIRYTVDAIEACRQHSVQQGITLTLENHYKDSMWIYPEFAQATDIFVEVVKAVPEGPGFGVNFDPSNCLIYGEDPIALLQAVKDRVVTMHASDRYFVGGNQAKLSQLAREPQKGYADYLSHGVIGQGLNDYDKIFSILRESGFDGWISIEDGSDPETSAEDIRQSALFLRKKMAHHGLEDK